LVFAAGRVAFVAGGVAVGVDEVDGVAVDVAVAVLGEGVGADGQVGGGLVVAVAVGGEEGG
jgi:hypothetical protein